MKAHSAEEILDKIRLIITTYNDEREHISDDRMGDLRAMLAVGTYLMVETILQPAYTDVTITEIALEKAEGKSFKSHFEALVQEKKSVSVATDLARKAMKLDEEYLAAMEAYSNAKQYAFLLNKLLDQANQVLNSMSRKTRV